METFLKKPLKRKMKTKITKIKIIVIVKEILGALESRLYPKRLQFQIKYTFTKTLKHRNCDQSKLQKNQKSE